MSDFTQFAALEDEATLVVTAAIHTFFDMLAEPLATDPHYNALAFVWRWGDGEGGWVLRELAEEALRRGLVTRPEPSWDLRTEVDELARRDGMVCAYCAKVLAGHKDAPFPHVDHVIPKSRGGSDALDNKVLACPECNMAKGARTPEEWRGE